MTRHIVNLPWVGSTRDDVSQTTARMRAASDSAVSIGTAPDVDEGTTDFMNKWDERRGDLAEYLQSVQDLLGGIYDSFNQTSNALRDATTDGGGA